MTFGLDGLIQLLFLTAPYIFLKTPSVNFTLFDMLLIIVWTFTIKERMPKELAYRYKQYYMLAGTFLVVGILSTLFSTSKQESFISLLQYAYIFIILFPTMPKIINNKSLKKNIILMTSGWSIFTMFNMFLLNHPSFIYGGGRFISFYNKPDEIGIMAAIMIPFQLLSIETYFNETNKRKFRLSIIGLFTNIIILLSTGTRSALVGAIFGLVIYLLAMFGLSKKILKYALLTIPASLLTMPYLSAERNTLSRLFTMENIEVRLLDYKVALEATFDHWLIGSGIGSSGPIMQSYGGNYRVHNMFLNFWLETGTIGLIVISLLLFICFYPFLKVLYNVIVNDYKAKHLVTSIYISGLVLLVFQQFNTMSVYRSYWFIWAICFWLSTQEEEFYLRIDDQNQKNKKI